MEDNTKKLYESLSSNGYKDLGDYKDFEGKLKDSGKREILYSKLKEDGFEDIGSLSDFNAKLGYPDIDTAGPDSGRGFWDTYLGDAIEKLNTGGAQLGAGLFGALDKATSGIEKLGLGTRGGMFKDASDYFKGVAEASRANSDRYNGKSYSDLWKEGDYAGAIGDIALQGVESLPMSISAAAATIAGAPVAGLAGIGAITASDKYDQLDAENPDMGEFAKASNAIITGAAEGASEMLGAGVSNAWMKTLYKSLGKEKAEQAVRKGLMGQIRKHFKEFGIFYEPMEEGIEEVASQLAENITDKITGVDPDKDIADGLMDSFVYGMGGGAYFSAVGSPGFVKRQHDKIKTRRDYKNAKIVFDKEFEGDSKMLGIGNELEAATPEEKVAFLEALELNDQFSKEQKEALLNLVQSDIAYKSLRTPEAVNEEKSERRELAIQTEMMNYDNANAPYIAENGMIQQVFVNGDMEHPVCIVKGDVAAEQQENGEMLFDAGKSSESMYYLDPNGKMQVVSPNQISGVANIVSAVDQRAQYEANLRARLDMQDRIKKQQRKQEEEQEISNGDDVAYMDPDTGKQIKGKVVDIMPESEYMSVDTGDGTLSTVPKKVVVKSVIQTTPVETIENGGNIDKTSEKTGRNESGLVDENSNMSQFAQSTDVQQPMFPMKGDEIDYKSISDPKMYADALVSEFGEDVGATIDDIITSKQKELAKASKNGDAIKRRRLEKRLDAELSMLIEVKDMISPGQQVEQVEPEVQSEPVQPEKTELNVEDVARPAIPVNENGDLLYHKADINDTLDELLDGSMTIDEVDQFVDANLSDVNKRLAATDKHTPKVGKDKRKFIADKQAWEAERSELQQELGYWGEVKEKLQDARMKPGEEAAINLMRNIAPQNGEELAAQMLANSSLKLSQESYKKELGVGMGEARSMFGLFAGKDKGGISIERAGELLMQADLENGTNFFDQSDPNAGRNAIIEVLSSARTRGDLIDYVKNERKAKAEQERQAEYNEYAHWCEENYHMSPEDYEAYEENIVRDFAEKQFTIEEQQELDSQIADEIQAIREEQEEIDAILAQNKSNNNENIEGNDESGGDGLREGGSGILQGEQPDQTGGTGEAETGESVGTGVDSTDGTAQESTSERIKQNISEAEQQVDISPTEAQKEAGNYKKGHVKIDGYDITIEQPAGSVRSGKDTNGKEWSVTMNNTYGYIRGTEGVDGDHIDVFLSDSPALGRVYVVDQVNADGSFDEHKVMYGFNSEEEAKTAYLSNYSPGWKGFGNITEISKEDFKKWIDSSKRKTKPFADYKIANKTDGVLQSDSGIRFRESKDEISSFAQKHNVNENDVRSYADAIKRGSLGGASYAFKNIHRTVRLANDNLSLGQFVKMFSPIKEELYKCFGNVDALREEQIQKSLEERSAMEAARKRAEEDAEAERKRLEEFELMSEESLDSSYFKAVEANDENRMRDIVNEAARRKGYLSTDEFRMAHRAPSYDEEGIDKSMVDVANNKDSIRESLNEQLRMNHDKNRDESAEAINTALDAINKGEKPTVTIYRAVPKSLKEGKVRNGDWVTLSESYAKQHGNHALDGNYRIMKEEVPSENLYWDGNDINEWGYDDKSDYKYKEVKNNRKLNDLITRDDKGNIIPPSKRFNSRKSDPRFRFIGEKGAANLDRTEEATTRLDNLAVAREMEEAGKDAKVIKLATGWERGTDGKWRYETGDSKLKDYITIGGKKFKRNEEDMLWTSGKLIDTTDDDELFKAYPKLANVRLDTDTITGDMPSSGSYNPKTKTIKIHASELKFLNNLLNHEIQHAIQDLEGFSQGGSPEQFMDKGRIKELKDLRDEMERRVENGEEGLDEELQEIEMELFDLEDDTPFHKYRSLSGEVEARNVEKRMNMTPKERRNSLASETEDVAREDQLFLDDALGGVSASMSSEVDAVNRKFNEELQQQIDGTLPKGHIYQLGNPSEYLQAAGIPNLPIELAASRLSNKSMQENHPFELSEITNLPDAIQDPIAVFRSATHIGSYVVMTEIEHRGKNFVVAIQTNRSKGKIEINDIRSIHYRTSNAHMANWIEEGLLEYADKERMSEWFSKQRYNSAEVKKLFGRATKVVESFVNPTLEEGKITSAADELSENLNTPVHIIRDVNEITDDNQRLQRQKRGSKGWYDPVTGETYLILPNAESVADAQATVLHEVVAHKGLRGLLGDNFAPTMDSIFDSLPQETQDYLLSVKEYKGDKRICAEEYCAGMAETMSDPGTIQKICSVIKEALRRIGIDLKMSDGDIMYMLWKSKNRLKNSDTAFDVMKKINADNAVRENIKEYDTLFRSKKPFDELRMSPEKKAELKGKIQSRAELFQEAYVDRMIAVKKLQDMFEKKTGKPIPDYMNVYLYENTLSSRNTYEQEQFKAKLVDPMVETVGRLKKKGMAQRNIENYVMAKHGLERNEKMRYDELADAIDAIEDDELRIRLKSEIEGKKFSELPVLSDEKFEGMRQSLSGKDFSGLTAIQKELGEVGVDDFITDTESRYKTEIKDLWSKIHAVNDFSLKKSFDSGMINRETYDKIKSMYEYYIPLRGFDEAVAHDVYDYYTDSEIPYNDPIKTAKGRTSRADDPLAYMMSMGNSAIVGGNKNQMKLHLYRLAQSENSEGLSVSRQWYVYTKTDANGKEIWEPSYPQFNEDPELYRKNIEDHNAEMLKLQSEGKAEFRKDKLKIDLKVSPKEVEEHTVKVKLNGEEFVVYVHGNPKVAQAINGLNSPEREQNKIIKGLEWMNRQMAANFTTRNPAFVFSNLSRDFIWSATTLGVKEGGKYQRRFLLNIPKASRALFNRVKAGEGWKADPNDPVSVMLDEFLRNGARTGYTALYSIDKYKKQIENSLATGKWAKTKRGYNAVLDFMQLPNEWAEDLSRFATYMTSRQEGRSILQSVSNAKEVSVNFNRKGSGAMGNQIFRSFFLFFNAAVQSLNNAFGLYMKNKRGTIGLLGSFAVAGMVVPFILSLLGDDDDREKYMGLPDYVRKNNLCIPLGFIGMDGFLKIPLPIELRAFYGIGDAALRIFTGYDEPSEAMGDITLGLLDLLPLNPVGGSSVFVPSALQPVVESYFTNEDFTGKPIAKITPFNEYDPEYQKVYRSTSIVPVKVSEYLNMFVGGDEAIRKLETFETFSGADLLNPAATEHLFEAYLGGIFTFLNHSFKTFIGAPVGLNEFSSRNIPVLNRFYDTGEVDGTMIKVNEKFYKYLDEMKEAQHAYHRYEELIDNSPSIQSAKYMQKLEEFENSDDWKRSEFISGYFEEIQDMSEEIKESTDEKYVEQLKKEISIKKKEMVDSLKNGKIPE